MADGWETLASGVTNADGRIGELLPPAESMPAGQYCMDFDTSSYMARCHAEHPAFFPPAPFYPRVHVHFQIAPGQARRPKENLFFYMIWSMLLLTSSDTR